MSGLVTVTLRIPKNLLNELERKVESRLRSEYIRQAIIDKLKRESSPPPVGESSDEMNELRSRIAALEEITRRLSKQGIETQIPALLEVIAYDETDKKIISYLIEKKRATTNELENVVSLRRRMILQRIKAIEARYMEKFGKPFLEFIRGKKDGKRQCWWISNQ